MINRTLNDKTQKAIMPILKDTEMLFLSAIRKESGSEGNVSITAMPDLGLANNAIRMSGGFYTGMFLSWKSSIPIIPVDATINSCGVSVFLLNNDISAADFKSSILNEKHKIKELGYNWNFERGNHFISLCKLDNGGSCIVMHASADEYKSCIIENALYPVDGVWYSDKIKMITDPTNKGRYLRYVVGSVAERFASIATSLESVNHKRMNDVANLLFGKYIDKEISYISHYGMPDNESIAIGCSWNPKLSILLTAPGKDFYIVVPKLECESSKWLTPHGLGVSANIDEINYRDDGLYINGLNIKNLKDVESISDRSIRGNKIDDNEYQKYIKSVINLSDARIVEKLHPVAALCKNGFEIYND